MFVASNNLTLFPVSYDYNDDDDDALTFDTGNFQLSHVAAEAVAVVVDAAARAAVAAAATYCYPHYVCHSHAEKMI